MNLPELGVGLTWFPGLEPALETNAGFMDLLDLLEIEPQTFWRRAPSSDPEPLAQVVDLEALRAIQSYSMPKLIHGVGYPVGGSLPPSPESLALLRQMTLQLKAPWVSEHLSFNRAATPSGTHFTSFFLPPRQTQAGVEAAVESIRAMQAKMPVPVAVETGVNYLRPRRDELPDGAFVARIAETANCGILLDLHNLWANQRNGRQSVDEFLNQLPLDRVWEMHLAGGSELRGYWLDAHSGAMPDELFELAATVVERLPNLKAILFEFFPAYLPETGYGIFRTQLELLRRLWDRRASRLRERSNPLPRFAEQERCESASPAEWESALGSLIIGSGAEKPAGPLVDELQTDPGVAIIREIVEQFRASMIVRTLRMASRLLILERGTAYFEQLLAEFWREHPPQPFSYNEAEGFAAYLEGRDHGIPYLREVLAYDQAMMVVALEGQERLVPFQVDPLPLLRALGAGRKPDMILYGHFEILLTPDLESRTASAASETLAIH